MGQAFEQFWLREGDGMVVFSLDPILIGGSALTFEYAGQVKKPRIDNHKSATECSEAFFQEVGRLRDLIESGPRESKQPGVYALALRMLRQYWEITKGSRH